MEITPLFQPLRTPVRLTRSELGALGRALLAGDLVFEADLPRILRTVAPAIYRMDRVGGWTRRATNDPRASWRPIHVVDVPYLKAYLKKGRE